MSIAYQLFTLAGVALGALTSFLVAAAGERARYQREVATKWQERKYECFAAYVNEVKTMSIVARKMAAFLGLTERATDTLSPDAGASLLGEADTRRSVATENLRLLSDLETIAAASKLNEAVWLLEWIVRGKFNDVTPQHWKDADAAFALAFDAFHRCARLELGVPGQSTPRAFPSQPNIEMPRIAQSPSRTTISGEHGG